MPRVALVLRSTEVLPEFLVVFLRFKPALGFEVLGDFVGVFRSRGCNTPLNSVKC